MNGVDTNVLVYSVDQAEPVKQAKAQDLIRQLGIAKVPTVILWQVLGETMQVLRRWHDQRKMSQTEADFHLAAFRQLFPLALPTAAVIDRAIDLVRRYSLSHWDSMLLGACLEAGVTTLYTEDMGAPRTIDSIRLINPFVP